MHVSHACTTPSHHHTYNTWLGLGGRQSRGGMRDEAGASLSVSQRGGVTSGVHTRARRERSTRPQNRAVQRRCGRHASNGAGPWYRQTVQVDGVRTRHVALASPHRSLCPCPIAILSLTVSSHAMQCNVAPATPHHLLRPPSPAQTAPLYAGTTVLAYASFFFFFQ